MPPCEASDSCDGGVPQPVEDSIEATAEANNASPGAPCIMLQHHKEVATPGGDEFLEQPRHIKGARYAATKPPRATPRRPAAHERIRRSKTPRANSELRLRVRLVFGRDCVKSWRWCRSDATVCRATFM